MNTLFRCCVSGMVLLTIAVPSAFGVDPLQTHDGAAAIYADDMTVITAWVEAVDETSGSMVRGYRILDSDNTASDFYFDEKGFPVPDAELRAWGIPEKDWTVAAYELPSYYPDWPSPAETTQPVPWTISKGIRAPEWVVAPLDEDLLREEDTAREREAGKSPLRVGVVRHMDIPVQVAGDRYNAGELYQWRDGTWLWVFSLRAPGATGIRLYLDSVTLPDGAQLMVYSPENTSDVYGPFGTGHDQWLPTCLGESIVLECWGENPASLEAFRLQMSAFVHLYRSPVEMEKAIGPCHIDLPCRPEWSATGAAVGRMTYVRGSGSYLCTGVLIASTGYVNTPPLFLSAFHCIGSQSVANTLEVWWLYAVDDCGGSPPDMATVPRTTGGARFLAGSQNDVGTDVSLLALNAAPPAGLPVAGYSTVPALVGDSAVCVHHPQGSLKKISFGAITDQGSPSQGGARPKPADRYHEVIWDEGTTEGGSSGSPLFSDTSGLIVGQLFGGYASCSAIYEPDYYGRFDVSYPILERWLVSETGYLEGEPAGEGEGEGEPCENQGCRQWLGLPCPPESSGQLVAARLAAAIPNRIDWLVMLAVSGIVLRFFAYHAGTKPRPRHKATGGTDARA